MKTIEQIDALALDLHMKLPMATQEDAIEFAQRFLAEWKKQQVPVAWMHDCSDNNDVEFCCVDFEPTHCMSVHKGDTKLYTLTEEE